MKSLNSEPAVSLKQKRTLNSLMQRHKKICIELKRAKNDEEIVKLLQEVDLINRIKIGKEKGSK